MLLAAALVGSRSSVFHAEASRVARLASGGRYGVAQALLQVGGNLGSAFEQRLAASIVLPRGQGAIAWVSLVASLAKAVLTRMVMWYAARLRPSHAAPRAAAGVPRKHAIFIEFVLKQLELSKNVYSSSLTSCFTSIWSRASAARGKGARARGARGSDADERVALLRGRCRKRTACGRASGCCSHPGVPACHLADAADLHRADLAVLRTAAAEPAALDAGARMRGEQADRAPTIRTPRAGAPGISSSLRRLTRPAAMRAHSRARRLMAV